MGGRRFQGPNKKMERAAAHAVADWRAKEEAKRRKPLKPGDVADGAHRLRIFAQEIERDGARLAVFLHRAGLTAKKLELAREVLKTISRANLRKGDDLGTKWTTVRFKRMAAAAVKELEKPGEDVGGRIA